MENSEPYIQKAIVNGLIATAVLWGFWTPFILVFVIGLVNNQIKDGLCQVAEQVGYNSSSITQNIAKDISQYSGISEYSILEWLNDVIKTSGTSAGIIVNRDPEVIKEANKNLSIIMIITCVLIILISIGLSYALTKKYNLNGWSIVRFNLVMALIIITIEAVFFVLVAMQFIPFYPSSILQNLADKINEYVKMMSGA